jgi:hypothetical protein
MQHRIRTASNLRAHTRNEDQLDTARRSQLALHHKSPKKRITIMKKLMLAFVTLALLHVPTAKAAYIGTFTADSSYSFEIVTSASVEWAVTFMSVVRGRLQVDHMVTDNGSSPPITIPVPVRAERVILLMDTRGGSALIRVVSGGVPREFNADPEVRLVADVVP